MTVSRPVLRVRPPPLVPPVDGAGECACGGSIAVVLLADRSSVHPTVCRFVHPRPCIYLR